ncbi:MAG: DUF6445 family protein [Asticcacaulis sp.]
MTDGGIGLNPAARIDLRQIGRERQPLLVIDDVLSDPDALVDMAKAADWQKPRHTQYPGLNAPLPAAYSHAVIRALRPLLQRGFGIPAHRQLNFFGFFALATQSPNQLQPIQKIPHRDSPDPFRIAMVHYLCRGQTGGTAFFRHQATGFESVDFERRETYDRTAAGELALGGDRLTRHVTAETPNYEQVDFAAMAFNRLVVYRSHVLHSGLLDESVLSEDPATGRLTANSFLEVVRPA